MQVNVTIDDALFREALDLADPEVGDGELIQEAIRTYVKVQAAKRLAAEGATMPELRQALCRREQDAK